MGKLRIISHLGDTVVEWERELAENGDAEAQEAVKEAERIFEEQLRRGATAFQVSAGTCPKLLERFDPEADQVVIVPRVVGG